MPHGDTGADVTARALARVEAARKRAIWADDFVALNADRRGKTRMEMREIRADLATDSARAELASLVADVPLLATIAAAAVRFIADIDARGIGDRTELCAAIRAAGEAGQ